MYNVDCDGFPMFKVGDMVKRDGWTDFYKVTKIEYEHGKYYMYLDSVFGLHTPVRYECARNYGNDWIRQGDGIKIGTKLYPYQFGLTDERVAVVSAIGRSRYLIHQVGNPDAEWSINKEDVGDIWFLEPTAKTTSEVTVVTTTVYEVEHRFPKKGELCLEAADIIKVINDLDPTWVANCDHQYLKCDVIVNTVSVRNERH
jgi:hypothetical protein